MARNCMIFSIRKSQRKSVGGDENRHIFHGFNSNLQPYKSTEVRRNYARVSSRVVLELSD